MATIEIDGIEIKSNLTGLYNISNIAFAVAIGIYFNISLDTIKQTIENYMPQNNRSQWTKVNGKNILLDAYNANPSSMHVAIENFNQLEGSSKLMILGDMFELGIESDKEHTAIIDEVLKTEIPAVFIGTHFFENQTKTDTVYYYENIEDFFNHLNDFPLKEQLILVKGSRGMALERILEKI